MARTGKTSRRRLSATIAFFALAISTLAVRGDVTSHDVLGALESDAHADPTLAPYSVHRDAKDPRWVQGEAIVDAAPDQVFALVSQVDAWPKTLTDVEKIKVLSHHGDHWDIELQTRTLPGGMLGYDVVTTPANRSVRLSTNRMGVYAIAQTDVKPGPTPTQSKVTYSFLVTLSGVPSLIISEKSLRTKQDHMVEQTIGDIYRAFKKPAP